MNPTTKSLSVLIAILSLYVTQLQSQDVVMSFTAGVSLQQNPSSNHLIVNRSSPRDEFTFDLAQVKASYYVGVGARYDLHPFFIAADALYNKREYVYNIANTFPGFGRSEETQIMTESMNVINIPLTLGVDLGLFDITSGFLPQVILSHDSDLAGLEGYSDKLSRLRLGWHSGVAANISAMRIGLSWQMDFNNYADHAYIGEQNLALQGRSNRFLASMSYLF